MEWAAHPHIPEEALPGPSLAASRAGLCLVWNFRTFPYLTLVCIVFVSEANGKHCVNSGSFGLGISWPHCTDGKAEDTQLTLESGVVLSPALQSGIPPPHSSGFLGFTAPKGNGAVCQPLETQPLGDSHTCKDRQCCLHHLQALRLSPGSAPTCPR